ncbi:MAG: arsenate reductase ArsC [Porticoccaceae bacterium]|nr:arsenate reductase ArsC [Pseudomonadales bacterium]MCP5171478.1 arsenate reductase ArsC [Pseudomonadales bacterium]
MKILFICTHNRCRSILAEAVFNHVCKGTIVARSAGSQPVGEVHPLSLKTLRDKGIPTGNLSSQSWDQHENWKPDVVITVCDSAAGEQCPIWFGDSIKVHWGLKDPSAMSGSDEDIINGFYRLIDLLAARATTLCEAKINDLSPAEQQNLLNNLGN